MLSDDAMTTLWTPPPQTTPGFGDVTFSPMTDGEASLSPRPPLVVDATQKQTAQMSEREEKLRKDRLRKKESKEKALAELDALKRTKDELEAQLAGLKQRKRKTSANHMSDESEWKKVALVERRRLHEAHAETQRLFDELVFEVDKGVLYRSLAWNMTRSQMLMDHRCDPFALHSLPANPADHAAALQRLGAHQQSKFTPDLVAKLPDSATGSPFSIVLDECSDAISFLEMFKYGFVKSDFRAVARCFFQMYAPHNAVRSNRTVTFWGDNMALAVYDDFRGQTTHMLYTLQIFDRHALWTYRNIVYHDAATGSEMAPSNVGGWFVFEDKSDGDGPKCAVRGYTQFYLHTPAAVASHEYTKAMNNSTQVNARMNDVLRQFGAVALN
ncbi:Aste57867_5083 [Aphanomyces stellatus]|uniref:Aste57867_5083 protein n=1 Tax=Aphanomyces stellatus TaxID=120398 RepID=A0A485KEZ6_9STRA|nr:hypothetical protein As57867_005070 [Aphanomyces stellatus]VFT82164.1 Aste57867_5083 [Aphanomyces stellatus]